MSDITLVLDEQQELEFDVEVQGITTDNVDVRFVLESTGMNFAFPGKLEKGIVTIDIPILSQYLKPDTYEGKLEFVFEGEKYFAPMKTKVELVQPVKIAAEVKETKKVNSPSVMEEIKAPTVRVRQVKTINEKILENLDAFAKASNKDELLEMYNEKVVKEENIKEALSLIDAVCKNGKGKSFKDYIKES